MNTPNEEEKESPVDSPLIRREAGEGWHPGGLNETLLGALVAREATLDAIVEAKGGDPEESERLRHQYTDQVKRITELKEQLGIPEPPPQMPPETPGTPE